MRCDGKGILTIIRGRPGQDTRVIPYADIEWDEPITVDPCPVCLGGGFRPVKPEKEWPTGAIHIHATNVDFSDIVALLPVKEPDDEPRTRDDRRTK